jgi:hypothetical protein
MTRERCVVSLFIAIHLAALSVAALPDPGELTALTSAPRPSRIESTGAITNALEVLAAALLKFESFLFHGTGPIRVLTYPYIATGIGLQQWYMFSRPNTSDMYVRADAFVTPVGKSAATRVFREILLPADDERRFRLFHQYRDKAILNTIEKTGSVDLQEKVPQVYEPLARYFAKRVTAHVTPNEQVRRIDIWIGSAPMAPPGSEVEAADVEARLRTIEPYRHGPAPIATTPTARATEHEADLTWTRVYSSSTRVD